MKNDLQSKKLSRRTVFAGAGTAGALAVAAAVLPRGTEEKVAQAGADAAADKEAGYQVTQHVLQYYQTARI